MISDYIVRHSKCYAFTLHYNFNIVMLQIDASLCDKVCQ